jgi:LPXTG-motif cell wall-anchored protein
MPVARRLAVAFAVVGLGVLSYAVPASATESRDSGACLTNPRPDQLTGTLDAQRGVATVRARAGVDVCADVWLSVYTVPDTWVGPDFNRTAVPQRLYRPSTPGRVTGTATTTLTAAVPTCGAVQIDLYTPPEITAVNDTTGHNGHLIQGYIWRWYADGQPLLCGVETSPPVPTPTETTPTPTPTESTTAPTPTPTESTTPPTPTESTTAPTPTPTDSTTPPTPTPAPTTPLSGLLPPGAAPGPIVAVPTTPAPPAPPVLASTGSDATVPLLGIGGVLLVAGIGLSVLGRRRRTA